MSTDFFRPKSPPYRHSGLARSTLLVVVALVVALLAIGAAGYMYFLQPKAVAGQVAKPVPPPDPTFVTIKPFTVNLSDDSGRVLYIGVSLQVADKKTSDQIKTFMPEVRNRILMTLSDQQPKNLTTSQGKRALADAIREVVRKPYQKDGKPLAVTNVLFTDFILQ
ncbi:MAG: flagellar basal body-associated protein FliL [Salinisphaera sp.]|nr:flagellar basal body-associated protein FliL [Salinisphaera sp.]